MLVVSAASQGHCRGGVITGLRIGRKGYQSLGCLSLGGWGFSCPFVNWSSPSNLKTGSRSRGECTLKITDTSPPSCSPYPKVLSQRPGLKNRGES